jgi:hypothetical protein
LLEPRIQRDADAREFGNLLAPQAGRSAARPQRKTSTFGAQTFTPATQKVRNLSTTRIAPWQRIHYAL